MCMCSYTNTDNPKNEACLTIRIEKIVVFDTILNPYRIWCLFAMRRLWTAFLFQPDRKGGHFPSLGGDDGKTPCPAHATREATNLGSAPCNRGGSGTREPVFGSLTLGIGNWLRPIK